MLFSEKLVTETKTYFRKKHSRKLTDAEASQYLEALGKLGLAACELLRPDRENPAEPSAPAPVALRLPGKSRNTTGLPVVCSLAGCRRAGGTGLVSQYPQTPVVGEGQ